MKIVIKNKFKSRNGIIINLTPLALAACGGKIEQSDASNKVVSFPMDFQPPNAGYDTPTEADPNFEILKSDYVEPYWIAALEMDRVDLTVMPMLVSIRVNFIFNFLTKLQVTT